MLPMTKCIGTADIALDAFCFVKELRYEQLNSIICLNNIEN